MSQSIIDLSRRAFIGGAAALGATSLIIPEFAFAETAAEKQAEADAVRNQLVGLQADLETAGENYYAALDEQESAQRSMEEQQVKIDETTEEIEGLQDRLSTRARSMYRSGSTTFIDFLLGASSFAEFTQNWELLNQINANDADLVDQTKAAREQLQAAKDEFARQEQIAAQKAAECKQIHDEVQVKVQNATELMKCFKYSYIVTRFCKITCTGKSGRTGTNNCNFVSVLHFCASRFDVMLQSVISNKSFQFTDGNSFALLTTDTLSFTLGLLRTYTTTDSRKCGRKSDYFVSFFHCFFLIISKTNLFKVCCTYLRILFSYRYFF